MIPKTVVIDGFGARWVTTFEIPLPRVQEILNVLRRKLGMLVRGETIVVRYTPVGLLTDGKQ